MAEKINFDNENYVAPKHKKHNILAFVICLLISLTIWVYVANVEILRANDDIHNDVNDSVETE